MSAVVLAVVVLVAVIAAELVWLVPITRARMVAQRTRFLGAVGVRLRKSLGVVIEGEPAGRCEMRGRRGGKDLVVRQRVALTPPWGGGAQDSTSIEVATTLRSQFVVPVAEVELTLANPPGGAALALVRSGHAAFDAAYALLESDDSAAAAGAPFRAEGPGAPDWASDAVLDGFVAAGPRWMRAHGETLTLAIAVGAPEALERAVALSFAVAGVALDAPVEVLPEPPPVRVKTKLFWDLVVVAFAAFPVWFALMFLLDWIAPFRAITESIDCGAGHRMGMVAHATSKGAANSSACVDDPSLHLWAHDLVTLMTVAALVLGGMIAFHYYRRYLRSLEGPK